MDITIDDDQRLLRDTALAFAHKALTPARIRELETTEDGFDAKVWRQMAEMGWAGAVFPEEYGGSGAGLLELALIVEALGQAAVPSPIYSTVVEAGLLLLDAGSPAQRERCLPRIAAGAIMTTAITEPGGGLAQMSQHETQFSGPDLTQGVELSTIPDGTMLLGHARDEPVLLIRRGDELFAIGANCTHYGAPLADGLLVDDTVRCPWHHACFSLRTGEAVRAPALDPVSRWRVDQRAGRAYVEERLERDRPRPHTPAAGIARSVVIVGGGAAGNAAAETLRREGYSGHITILSADDSLPCDRPNSSKGISRWRRIRGVEPASIGGLLQRERNRRAP